MRNKNYVSIIGIFIAIFFIMIPKVYSVMIPLPFYEQPVLIITYLIITVIINIIIEYSVVYIFLRSGDLVKKKLFSSVALVNLVIFLPTYSITYLILAFYIKFYVLYTITIGIIMILIECFLYWLEFQKLLYRKAIDKSLSFKKVLLISTLANFASFSFIYLYPIILMIYQYITFPEIYISLS